MKIKLLTRSGLLIALGIILPYITHMTGVAGSVLLPMHLPPLLAGFLISPFYALLIGAILPPLNFAISGMPPMPTMAFMILELSAFGLFTGLIYHKLNKININKKSNIFISLIGAMLIGRIIYVLIFSLLIEFENPLAIIAGGIITGLPGIISQLILIPLIVISLENKNNLKKNSKKLNNLTE